MGMVFRSVVVRCGGDVTITYSQDPGTLFPVGTTEVTATAKDEAGNISSCTFTVTVNDTEAPVLTSCPLDIVVDNETGSCSAVVNFMVEATDNCTAAGDIVYTYSHQPGTAFPVGTTQVTVTARDAANNISEACVFNVTVKDVEAPVITCPGDIVVNNDPGQCGALVPLSATATDNCGVPTITYSPALTVFPVGVTTVTATAKDEAGNESTC